MEQNEVDSKFWEVKRLMGLKVHQGGVEPADLLE